MAIEADPPHHLAHRARAEIGKHAPEQQARNDHAEKIELVFHAAILPCFGLVGRKGRSLREKPERTPASPTIA